MDFHVLGTVHKKILIIFNDGNTIIPALEIKKKNTKVKKVTWPITCYYKCLYKSQQS